MAIFNSANILLPKNTNMSNWSVIACDQFTSEPEYWEKVKEAVGADLSTLNLILPEVYLKQDFEKRIENINKTMAEYLDKGIFKVYPDAYIYVERTLADGTLRRGLVGAVDLEEYSYALGSKTHIRATEKTVLERIPPRVKIRENAPIELPHILILCNDAKDMLLSGLTEKKESMELVYDFTLLGNGGSIKGWLVEGSLKREFEANFEAYAQEIYTTYNDPSAMVLAVGDGNHSLATAKACYEQLKANNPEVDLSNHPARYALVELENMWDESQQFEPIHRVLVNVDAKELLEKLAAKLGDKGSNYQVKWNAGNEVGIINIKSSNEKIELAQLQEFLDEYLANNAGEIDYVHDAETVVAIGKGERSLGLVLPDISKEELFRNINLLGILPRKTFSMGHDVDKRYYLEARVIK